MALCCIAFISASAFGKDGTKSQDAKNTYLLKFRVCTSWGYNSATVEFADIVIDKFPAIKIEEETYPPPELNQCIASFIYFTKFIFIILILTKIDPFSKVGLITPQLYLWAINNVIYATLMTYFVCKAVETQLLSTGAFEITMNETLLWSKLESGRIPTVDELLEIIEKYMKN